MATWKKVIVSGSAAELASLNVDGAIVAASLSGSFSGSFQGNGSGLTGVSATSLDIDNFGNDLTAITVAGTDKLALSDAGTEGRITVSQLATPLAGTGLEANSGTVRIAAAAAGAGLTGGAGSALAVGAGTHITVNANDVQVNVGTLIPAVWATSASYTGSIFTQVSGDITLTAAGVASIGTGKVTSANILDGTITNADISVAAGITYSKLNLASSGIVSGSAQIDHDATTNFVANEHIDHSTVSITAGNGLFGGGTIAATRTLSVDSGSMATYFRQDAYSNVSGDITIASNGTAAIGSGVIVNADVSATAAIAASKINFAGTSFVSASSLSSLQQGEVILTTNGVAASPVDLGLQTTDSPTFAGATLDNIRVGITGANEIDTTSGNLTIDSAGGTVTIDDNLTVTGNLTINGTTTTIDTQNILMEDRFIIVNYGSGSVSQEGGIIVEGGTAGSGTAWYYDSTTQRWGVNTNVSGTATAATQQAHVTLTYIGTTANATSAGFDDEGNIVVDSGDIYIYS